MADEDSPQLTLNEQMGVAVHAVAICAFTSMLFSACFLIYWSRSIDPAYYDHPELLPLLPMLRMIGAVTAYTVVAILVVLPLELPGWLRVLAVAGSGAIANLLWVLANPPSHGEGTPWMSPRFLALAGALPGLVLSSIYYLWLARRRPNSVLYLGASLLAGVFIAALYGTALLRTGIWRWPWVTGDLLGSLWAISTVFSLSAMIPMYYARRGVLLAPLRRKKKEEDGPELVDPKIWPGFPMGQNIWRGLTYRQFAGVWFYSTATLSAILAPMPILSQLLGILDLDLSLRMSSMIGNYFVAVGIVSACILLRPGLDWKYVAGYGMLAGMAGGLCGGILSAIFRTDEYPLGILATGFMGLLPGLVITPIYSAWLAGRRLRYPYYVLAAVVAGAILMVSFGPLLFLRLRLGLALAFMVYTTAVMTALFVSDRALVSMPSQAAKPSA